MTTPYYGGNTLPGAIWEVTNYRMQDLIVTKERIQIVDDFWKFVEKWQMKNPGPPLTMLLAWCDSVLRPKPIDDPKPWHAIFLSPRRRGFGRENLGLRNFCKA